MVTIGEIDITVGHIVTTARAAQVQAKAAADTPEGEPTACALLLLTALHMVYLSEPGTFDADMRATLDEMAAEAARNTVAAMFAAPQPEARH